MCSRPISDDGGLATMSDPVASVSSQEFDAVVLEADGLVLVEFWTPWWGPCRALIPRVEAVAERLHGRLKVVKVNTDEAADIAARYGLTSVPTLVLFAGGQVVDTIIDGAALGVPQLVERLTPYLGESACSAEPHNRGTEGSRLTAEPSKSAEPRSSLLPVTIAVAAMLVALVAYIGVQVTDPRTPRLAEAAQTTQSQANPTDFRIGSDATIRRTNDALLFADHGAWDEFARAEAAQDEYSAEALVRSGRAFIVQDRTRIRVLDRHWTGERVQVRVLEGEHGGAAGWIAPRFLGPAIAATQPASRKAPGETARAASGTRPILGGPGCVLFAADREALEELARAVATSDGAHSDELLRSGRLFPVNSGTPLQVLDLDAGDDLVKVRILKGKRKEATGWISEQFVGDP
jgi:thioredoxin 1